MRQKHIRECFVTPTRLGMGELVGLPRRAQSNHSTAFLVAWFAKQILSLSIVCSNQRYAKGI
jgi:hypothetical protein